MRTATITTAEGLHCLTVKTLNSRLENSIEGAKRAFRMFSRCKIESCDSYQDGSYLISLETDGSCFKVAIKDVTPITQKYDQDFTEVPSQEFCADIIKEVENWSSDVFITYEQIEKMQYKDKAIIITRKNGCQFVTPGYSDALDSWKSETISLYTVEKGLRLIRVSKCNYDQAKIFLTV